MFPDFFHSVFPVSPSSSYIFLHFYFLYHLSIWPWVQTLPTLTFIRRLLISAFDYTIGKKFVLSNLYWQLCNPGTISRKCNTQSEGSLENTLCACRIKVDCIFSVNDSLIHINISTATHERHGWCYSLHVVTVGIRRTRFGTVEPSCGSRSILKLNLILVFLKMRNITWRQDWMQISH